MVSKQRFLFAVCLILLVLHFSAVSAPAQKSPVSKPPVAEKKVPEPNASPALLPTPPALPPTSEEKTANERLSFMADSERDNHEQAAPSASGLLLRTLGALLLIIGLIVAAAWGIKRFGGARFGAPKEDAPELAVLNSISLGEKRSLAIVRFGQRTLLVGSTAQSVTLLAETETDDIATPARSVAEILKETSPGAFAEELSTASNRLDDSVWMGGEEN